MTRASRVPPAAQVTTTLVGLSQLRFRWDLLGPATREAIVAAVDGAAFIAIDCEMSGLWRDVWLGGSSLDSLDSLPSVAYTPTS